MERCRGLSPHVRGNLLPGLRMQANPGSIPARAGEPLSLPPVTPCYRVYPRTCGGTPDRLYTGSPGSGLSPHVRGNLFSISLHRGMPGSIPARAGEPPTPYSGPDLRRVYPRTCGGTWSVGAHDNLSGGLSPHVRGNRVIAVTAIAIAGSIPARAGEPSIPSPGLDLRRVYPRTCGGTSVPMNEEQTRVGLSPHVRGNLVASIWKIGS